MIKKTIYILLLSLSLFGSNCKLLQISFKDNFINCKDNKDYIDVKIYDNYNSNFKYNVVKICNILNDITVKYINITIIDKYNYNSVTRKINRNSCNALLNN